MSGFNLKNIDPRSIAIIISIVAASLGVILVLALAHSSALPKALLAVVLFSILLGYVCFRLVDEFLYRKVKLIYKFITSSKSTYQEESLQSLLPRQTNLDQVTEEVVNWANLQKSEIEELRVNEVYRREFLMNLSHEIKTPIFALHGYLHMLRDTPNLSAEERLKFINASVRGADRLAAMVEDLDELIKLEQGQISLQRTNYNIKTSITEVFEELEFTAKQKEITLSFKSGADNNLIVNADKHKIKQVLHNLVINSIKYGKQAGTTTVGIYVVDGKSAYIEVTDNGIGISDAHVGRVFERFYRTDDARSKNSTGTGLGLAIVKHIVEAHGHTVICRSTLGVGSSFGFGLDIGG